MAKPEKQEEGHSRRDPRFDDYIGPLQPGKPGEIIIGQAAGPKEKQSGSCGEYLQQQPSSS